MAENSIISTDRKKDINNAATAETAMDRDGKVNDNLINAVEEAQIIHRTGGERLLSKYIESEGFMSDLIPMVIRTSEGSNASLEDAIAVNVAKLSSTAPQERRAPFNGNAAARNEAIVKRVDEAMRPGTLFGRAVTGNIYHGSTKAERESAMNDPRLLNEISRQFDLQMGEMSGSTMKQSVKDEIALDKAMNNVMSRVSFIDGQALIAPSSGPTIEEMAGLNGDTTALTRGVKDMFKEIAPVLYEGRGYDFVDWMGSPKMDMQFHAESGNLIIRPYDDVPTGIVNGILPFLRPDQIIQDPMVINVRDVGQYIRAKDLGNRSEEHTS